MRIQIELPKRRRREPGPKGCCINDLAYLSNRRSGMSFGGSALDNGEPGFL